MTHERIKQVADFFYSSDDASDVPLRPAIITGQFSGADLSKRRCIQLLKILSDSEDLKSDLKHFLEDLEI